MIPTAAFNSYYGIVMRDIVLNNVRVGSMEPIDVSLICPTLFMHYCNVDKLYAEWQEIGDNFDKYGLVSKAPDGFNLNDNVYSYDITEWQSILIVVANGDTPSSMINYKSLGYKHE